jgi:thymidylate synthase, flavin-dependent|nr:MAG TPA: Thymidylate synthase complementing protein [Caudoviricetes sp.]
MEIKLLYYTPIEVLAEATSMPYQSEPTNGLVKRVFDTDHRSVVRHGMAAFTIKDVSQSLLRQISRHPHINLTVKSSRYCDMSNVGFYVTEKALEKMGRRDEYVEDMENVMGLYHKWKIYEGGEKEVDVAKLFLPLSSYTDIVVSGNYQALYEFLQLRNCVRAEGEINNLSLKLTNILKECIPEIFAELDCRGKELGYCPEFKTCGKYPKKGQ